MVQLQFDGNLARPEPRPVTSWTVHVPNAAALTDRDLYWMTQLFKGDHQGYTSSHALDWFLKGTWWLFRLQGIAEGLVACEIVQHPAGRELSVLYVAGRNLFRAKGKALVAGELEQLMHSLAEFGREHGCKWLTGHAPHDKLIPAYREVMDEPKGVSFRRTIG